MSTCCEGDGKGMEACLFNLVLEDVFQLIPFCTKRVFVKSLSSN